MDTEIPSIFELPQLDKIDAWDDPIYFDEVETPEIPALLLPRVLGDYASALAIATETPEALAVMTILGVISAIAAKRFKVCPKTGWQEPINIYTLIALPPANNKSLVLSQCTKLLRDWEHEQVSQLASEIQRQRSERKTEEKIIEGLRQQMAKKKDENELRWLKNEIAERELNLVEPKILPRLFTTDATAEALASNVCEQGGRFAIFFDEGGIVETLGGLYNGGKANIDIFLKGIDGGDVRISRKDRNISFNPYLTVVLTVQPAIIQNLGDKRAFSGNGALERFLYVLPKSYLGYRTHDKPPVPSTIEVSYHHQIASLLIGLTADTQQQSESILLTLAQNAKERWLDFQADVEKQLRPQGKLSLCQGWGGKIAGFTLRIAGLLHIAEHGNTHLEITELAMANAIKIAEALIEHAIAAYRLMRIDLPTEHAKEILQWMVSEQKPYFTKTEITKAMRHRKWGKAENLNLALNILIERNLVSEPQQRATRKPTTVYYIHPAFLQESNQLYD